LRKKSTKHSYAAFLRQGAIAENPAELVRELPCFPVDEVTEEDIRAALTYAGELIEQEEFHPLPK